MVYIATVAKYDLYCHYVAGLAGEGLTAIWSASGKEAPWLGKELGLSNSMGLLLQKTNITCDFHEYADEKRFFWPKEICGKYGFNDLTELYQKENLERATWVQSEMVLDALRPASQCDSLDYLRLLKNQSVFVFSAIPATTMAISTLSLCFMNPDMFQRYVKIRKAEAARV
jgi:farnesyl-diphosphate farnesyltransferase